MTFLEKAKELGYSDTDVINKKCPSALDLEDAKKACDMDCVKCWNREMPNTESKEEPSCDDVKAAYDKGMADAWELAKRVVRSPKLVENAQIFLDSNIVGIERESLLIHFFELTPQEALAKLKAYEELQKIKINDEVETARGKGVVTCVGNDICWVLMKNADYYTYPKDVVKKTGKYIDIQSILEQIGGE